MKKGLNRDKNESAENVQHSFLFYSLADFLNKPFLRENMIDKTRPGILKKRKEVLEND
ncbi:MULTISPECIES: hypothetical protein [Bacillaceae]|uniref:Uncharacterized protein n=1 Tax=Bacillus infantis NRRL B-14911 TaxID=1367477 RepID=U5LH98_9BACI|nr:MULTISPECIES: hypothetical protein [Bacillus]AGX05977.1 hypothetical protein N288_20655 [Bacillus infantis NRRL B-14911]EAR64130.1 glucose-6-phosphate isomerase [Bacillus sp. NRRL B-14911]MCK6207567.1 hypothetical protein [Bacillus infantis]MDW2879789.1 hypothetical protein [Bacillus infantis]